jgi:lipoprotein-releasing system ATP-binding protein
VANALKLVGLSHKAQMVPYRLSGGEQQRVAIARALMSDPLLLLADEPTGDLDGRTAQMVFELISRIHRDHQLTSLIVTHNLEFARRCDRVLRLGGGRVEEVAPQSLPA